MCLHIGGLMEDTFISPGLRDMNKLVLILFIEITWEF